MSQTDQFAGYHEHDAEVRVLHFEVWHIGFTPWIEGARAPGWYWWTVYPRPADADLKRFEPMPVDAQAHGPYPTAEGAYLAAVGD